MRVTFPLIPAAYTSTVSVQVSGFEDLRLLTHCGRLLCGSCSSGQCYAFGFLQIPPRDGHPCRSANRSPCRADSGLAPPSHPATTTCTGTAPVKALRAMASPYAIGQHQPKMALDPRSPVGATHASPVLEGVRPATASDSAAAAEGWRHMRAGSLPDLGLSLATDAQVRQAARHLEGPYPFHLSQVSCSKLMAFPEALYIW